MVLTALQLQREPPTGRMVSLGLAMIGLLAVSAPAQDLAEIRQAGVLRHLGIPYANFVTGADGGFDVELVQRFASHIGVKYLYVRADWSTLFGDLTGESVKPSADKAEFLGPTPVRGDIAASGITILPWRQSVADFSQPEFPTQVWLVSRAGSDLRPIHPSGSLTNDISAVRQLLANRSLFCKANTCLDPGLYNLAETKAAHRLFEGSLNELAPAIIKGEAELTLLDVADTIVALQKWPGSLKILGPISSVQNMGVAFRKTSPQLREAFDCFLADLRADGSYLGLVEKYYPLAPNYFPEFFRKPKAVARSNAPPAFAAPESVPTIAITPEQK